MRVLCLIPARGGSKGLPGKNLRVLGSHPMIAHTIRAAREANPHYRCLVSTDSEEIATIARRYGAEVPFLRPERLASDQAPMTAVADHALDWLRGTESYEPDWLVLLQPTSPLRPASAIRASVERAMQTSCNSVVSVCEVEHPVEWSMTMNPEGYLTPRFREQYHLRRQDCQISLRPTGAIYVVRTAAYLAQRSFECEPVLAHIMDRELSVDVDSLWDFELAEWMLKRNEQDLLR